MILIIIMNIIARGKIYLRFNDISVKNKNVYAQASPNLIKI